jgi:hypothetical protein
MKHRTGLCNRHCESLQRCPNGYHISSTKKSCGKNKPKGFLEELSEIFFPPAKNLISDEHIPKPLLHESVVPKFEELPAPPIPPIPKFEEVALPPIPKFEETGPPPLETIETFGGYRSSSRRRKRVSKKKKSHRKKSQKKTSKRRKR